MDTLYIKMCEKCEEIQKLWKHLKGDLCYWENEIFISQNLDEPVIVIDWENLDGNFAILITEPNDEFGKYSKYTPVTWLPRQDELQRMLEENPSPNLFARFISFLGWDGVTFCNQGYPMTRPPNFTSMEQLWLAFVMKEKYSKQWSADEQEWVVI